MIRSATCFLYIIGTASLRGAPERFRRCAKRGKRQHQKAVKFCNNDCTTAGQVRKYTMSTLMDWCWTLFQRKNSTQIIIILHFEVEWCTLVTPTLDPELENHWSDSHIFAWPLCLLKIFNDHLENVSSSWLLKHFIGWSSVFYSGRWSVIGYCSVRMLVMVDRGLLLLLYRTSNWCSSCTGPCVWRFSPGTLV